jgi:hypothetical protein
LPFLARGLMVSCLSLHLHFSFIQNDETTFEIYASSAAERFVEDNLIFKLSDFTAFLLIEDNICLDGRSECVLSMLPAICEQI